MLKTVNFLGLNCYCASIISIAAHFGIDYMPAFSDLWWETDFRYDDIRGVYLSRRLYENLLRLGARTESASCACAGDTRAALSRIKEGDCFVAGMDSYVVPWNDIFGQRHGWHYFIMQKSGDRLLCADPTYGRSGMELTMETLLEHAFEIVTVSEVAPTRNTAPPPALSDNIQAIEAAFGALRETLAALPVGGMPDAGLSARCLKAARYADALISSRLLFRRYVSSAFPDFIQQSEFMPDGFGLLTLKLLEA